MNDMKIHEFDKSHECNCQSKNVIYRRKTVTSGNVVEVECYPVFPAPKRRRGKKKQKSTNAQANLNDKNSMKNLTRTANATFTENDIFFTGTFTDANLPPTDSEAARIWSNFMRRAARAAKKNGKELKWLCIMEHDRIHFHCMISGVSYDDLARLWKLGLKDMRPLRPDDYGLTALAIYFGKENKTVKGAQNNVGAAKRWSCSKSCSKPKVTYNDSAITKKQLMQLIHDDDERQYKKLLKPRPETEYIFTGGEYSDIHDCADYKYLERKYQINDISGFYVYATFCRVRNRQRST